MKDRMKKYLLLLMAVFIYSCSSVFNKLASYQDFLSIMWIMLYMVGIVLLGIYAIVWQMILKDFPLTVAYSCRACVVILGILWGWGIFGEKISVKMVIGAIVIMIGVRLVIQSEDE